MESMAIDWCSSLSSSWAPDMSSFLPTANARRVLASNKDSFHNLDLHPCSSQLSHPGHLVPVVTRVEETSRSSTVWLCHTLGYSRMEVPKKLHVR